MEPSPRSPIALLVARFLPRLRYPYLFLVLGALFLVDLVVPDPIPMLDEVLLAVLTFLAATLTTREEPRPQPRDVTPAEDENPAIGPGDDRQPTDGG
jgi:hypothetical protein